LYRRRIRFTQFNLADAIVSAAHLVMSGGSGSIPAALVKGVDVELVNGDASEYAKIPKDLCIYNKLYNPT